MAIWNQFSIFLNNELPPISNGLKQKSPNLNDSGKSRDDWLSIKLFGGGFGGDGKVF